MKAFISPSLDNQTYDPIKSSLSDHDTPRLDACKPWWLPSFRGDEGGQESQWKRFRHVNDQDNGPFSG